MDNATTQKGCGHDSQQNLLLMASFNEGSHECGILYQSDLREIEALFPPFDTIHYFS